MEPIVDFPDQQRMFLRIQQRQPGPDIVQPEPGVLFLPRRNRFVKGIADLELHPSIFYGKMDVYLWLFRRTDAVFERVFHEGNQQHRFDGAGISVRTGVDLAVDPYVVAESKALQLYNCSGR